MNLKLLKTAIINTIPVMMGYIVLGIGFGILFEKNGYGLGWTLAMSIFVFAGSMQYVGIGLITGGVSLISTALTTLMVNARHLFYGVSMNMRHSMLYDTDTDNIRNESCGRKTAAFFIACESDKW